MLRTLAEMENLRSAPRAKLPMRGLWHLRIRARRSRYRGQSAACARCGSADTKAAADPGLKALIEGVELTERSLLNALEKKRRQEIRPIGREIRPEFSTGDV